MKLSKWLSFSSMVLVLAAAGAARAETKVELKGVHLCCDSCVDAVNKIFEGLKGVKGKCDQDAKTVTITADNAAAAQKAVDALFAGGFAGKTDSKDVKTKDLSGAKKGTVKKLTLTGAHNCCDTCTDAIKAAAKKVKGVTGDTAEPKAPSFEVSGDFDATELVKALNAAGFGVKVKK